MEFNFRPVDALSGGQRQRVWIAMALAQETDIIFLDEPTTYLDMAHQLEVLEILQNLNKKEARTIVMVLHDLNQAARFADHMIALKNGKIVRTGTCHDVMNREVLKQVFHIDAVIEQDPRTQKPMCITYNLLKGEDENEKILLASLLLLLFMGSACSNDTKEKDEDQPDDPEAAQTGTITYESENGPIEVPADPQRVVVLSSYAGDVIKRGVNIVGADSWSMDNPNFADELVDAQEVSDDSLEKIIESDPDLIIGLSTIKNVDKLNEIAPTVTFTYGKVDYLQQHIEIGKVLNKEKEATLWVEDFKQRAKELGEEVKEEIGEDTTVSVIEDYDKQLYVFGDNWGRGTEILYQEMGLKMPKSVEEMALKIGRAHV